MINMENNHGNDNIVDCNHLNFDFRLKQETDALNKHTDPKIK